jgi:hypothetical protein
MQAGRAEAVVERSLRDGVAPSVALFNVVLDAHGKSPHPDAPERAEGVCAGRRVCNLLFREAPV